MWTNIIDIMIKVKPFLALIIAALFIGITSCSKKESIELQPKTQDTPPTPPPPLADTLDLFIAKAWVRTKVYKNNIEQANHFLINSSYKFNTPDSYLFSIPNFPSASGTWVFDANTKGKVTLTSQGGPTDWTIVSINTNAMTIEETVGSDVLKYDFTH